MTALCYAELAAATNFSFLQGASRPNEMVETAIGLGHIGIGIADRNTVSGVVRAYTALKELKAAKIPGTARFTMATGTRLCFNDGTPDILAYAATRDGWGTLCRLLTIGNRRAKKGDCELGLPDLLADTKGLLLIIMPPRNLRLLPDTIAAVRDGAPGAVWLAASMHRQGTDQRRLARLAEFGRDGHVPLIAVNDVLYHSPARRPLQDILTCIREGTTVQAAGRRLQANAERHLKSAQDMADLFRSAPFAMEETAAFLARISFSLGDLRYEYPDEPVPPGKDADEHLGDLTWARAKWFYEDNIPPKVETLLTQELELIRELQYARYFLTIHDIVRFAENQRILCQGRGSAANSAVCFALGITCVDPAEISLLFARFLSKEREEPPDIDVDFEHERREEVIQYLYERYGRHRAGIAATVIHYRLRSSIRDVGKALGLSEDVTAALAGLSAWWDKGISEERLHEAGLDLANPLILDAIRLAAEITGFPRHLSQHVGGFVLARDRLDELVPIGNAAMKDRTFIEWDKDDIDSLGLMKVDVLALGMLTCIRKAFDLLRLHGQCDWGLAQVPIGDSDVYEMLCKGDSVGVFQVESRAQINMLPRMKPRAFYDLVIEVAIVRPGPIQGDMVHPYLRRRNHEEDVAYPSPAPPADPDELRNILERTLGVPIFQEQAMQLAIDAAKFTPEEANGLRRAMATFRSRGQMLQYEQKMVEGMVARGYDRDFATRCFSQIKGFGEYGFPESHAASFAKLVYISSWLKHHYPAVFTCALLNAQPMGFYAPSQLVQDAQAHNVRAHPVDVSHSQWNNTLIPLGTTNETGKGLFDLQLGFRQVTGFREDWAEKLVQGRAHGFSSIEDVARYGRVPRHGLEMLAGADAFRSLGYDRREALWHVRRLPAAEALPLFQAADARELAAEPEVTLPSMSPSEQVVADYRTTRLSLKGHLMEFLRPLCESARILSCHDAANAADGRRIRVAGVVLIRQRPGKGNAIFMTLEDESGIMNVLIWARLLEQFRKEIVGARLMVAEGVIQRSKEGVVHLMAERLHDRTSWMRRLTDGAPVKPELSRADEIKHPQTPRHPRNVRILPRSRDFH